jgi:hypothetical protein
MVPQLKALLDQYRAAGASDDQLRAAAAVWAQAQPVVTTPQNTDINLRNLGRAAGQGMTFGMGTKFGLDPDAQKAFALAHPVANFLSELAGGAVAPAVAVAAAPEALGLATLGGAATLGAASGILNGVGQPDADASTADRLKGGAIGGLFGAAGGAAGYGVGKVIAPIASKAAAIVKPQWAATRAVAGAAKGLLDDPNAIAAHMDEMNTLAPGSSSVASATIAQDGTDQSRFLPMVRGTGASPEAAAGVEAKIVAQRAAIDAGKKALGAKMNALQTSDIPITPKVRDAMNLVKPVLGAKAPSMPPPPPNMFGAVPPAGLQSASMSAFGANPAVLNPAATTMSLEEARDALSRLRYLSRQQEVLGVSANGITKHDVNQARIALQEVVYDHRPDFAPLDRQYAKLSTEEGATEDELTQVQRSRAAHAGNAAFGTTAGSLGGSLPSGAHGVVMNLFDNILTDKAAAADAVQRLVVQPGGADMVQRLLSKAPGPGLPKVTGAMRAGLFSALPPAMRGLFFDSPPTP